jgi:FkbM family methyltransferase
VRLLYALPEREHLKRLFEFLDIDCVFDVGANLGQYATMLRDKVGYAGRIISFEPIPHAVSVVKGLAANDPLWTIEELALSNQTGERQFNVMSDLQFSSLASPKNDEVDMFARQNVPTKIITVKTETLDEAYARLRQQFGFKRPFLKMDTQGFDVQVAGSGRTVIGNFLGMQSEMAIKKLYDQSVDFREAIAFYQSLGFELSAIVPNNAGHFPLLIESDCILVRKDFCDLATHAS